MKEFICLSCVRLDTPVRVRPHHFTYIAAERGYRALYSVLHLSAKDVETRPTDARNVNLLTLTEPIYTNFMHEKSVSSAQSAHQLAGMLDEPPTILVNAPYWCTFALELQEKTGGRIIYDVLDRFEEFADLKRHARRLGMFHDKLLREADLVTYTARDMEHYVGQADNPVHIPNGCEFDLWDLPRQPRRRVQAGYMGVMTDWFDTGVVGYLMGQRDIRVQLAGSMSKPIRMRLFGTHEIANRTEYLGIVNYKDLPRQAARWSVGLIPFVAMDITQATDPNKFYEYYALGLPVVASNLRELRHISDSMPELIRPCLLDPGRGKKWHRAIMREIETDTDVKIATRKQWAAGNTWNERFDTLMEALNVTA